MVWRARRSKKAKKLFALEGSATRQGILVEVGSSQLTGIGMKVCNSRHFDGMFEEGEKVLDVGIFSTNPKDLLKIFRILKERIPELKKQGFAGIAGETSCNAIVSYAKKRHNAKVLEVSKLNKAIARFNYACSIVFDGFPVKYLKTPVQRVVIRF